jgi:hypothetical protein
MEITSASPDPVLAQDALAYRWLRLIHPASVSSMNCHGFSSGVTFALLHRLAVDDPISGQDGQRAVPSARFRVARCRRQKGSDVFLTIAF